MLSYLKQNPSLTSNEFTKYQKQNVDKSEEKFIGK